MIEFDDWIKLIYVCFLDKQTDTLILPSSILPSQLDHDNPLHPGNMSSLIRLVSAALEKPQAPCGEGPTREASAATRQRRPAKEEQEDACTETAVNSVHRGWLENYCKQYLKKNKHSISNKKFLHTMESFVIPVIWKMDFVCIGIGDHRFLSPGVRRREAGFL